MIDVASNPSDAVEMALDKFGNDILRLAFSYLKSRDDAEDIVQEVLIRFMQSGAVFEKEAQVKSWLLTTAANLCKDQLKSATSQKVVALPEGYDVAVEDEEQEEDESILQVVMSLPEKYRSAIHLYYYEEYSVKEIAEILQKKEVTVRSLLKRGREKMEQLLSKRKMLSQEKMMKGERDYAE